MSPLSTDRKIYISRRKIFYLAAEKKTKIRLDICAASSNLTQPEITVGCMVTGYFSLIHLIVIGLFVFLSFFLEFYILKIKDANFN
jgi:hypothetical protein